MSFPEPSWASRMEFFAKLINKFKPLTSFWKGQCLGFLTGFPMRLCFKLIISVFIPRHVLLKFVCKSEVIKYKSTRLIHVFLTFFDVSLLQANNICLKINASLLQYTFYQFQHFITTCLHGRNLSTKVSVKKF